MTRKYEIYGEAFKPKAYKLYQQMREQNPIFRQPGFDGVTPIWFVSSYEAAEAILRDDKTFARDARRAYTAEEMAQWQGGNKATEYFNHHMLNRDGDNHRRLRALVGKAFTPKRIQALRPRIAEIAADLLDQLEGRTEADLVEAYAFPLPIIVIAELLGIPVADRDRFRVWSNAIVSTTSGPEAFNNFLQLMQDFMTYLTQLFAQRRADPQDDLISALLTAEEAGDTLSEQELYSMMMLLITAGHETTVGLIANGTLALLQHPDQMALLREHPELMPQAVEELLRYDGPVERALTRFVTTDTTFCGHEMKRGDMLVVIIGAADRDEAVTPNGETLDITRRISQHLAFGKGIHYCLGAPLARLEAEIALTLLLARLPNLRLNTAVDTLTYRPSTFIRALESLPVAWEIA